MQIQFNSVKLDAQGPEKIVLIRNIRYCYIKGKAIQRTNSAGVYCAYPGLFSPLMVISTGKPAK